MKALILVGGYGTRLRPLTLNHPKSVFPFANKPMVEHQIEALAKVGVKEVILAVNYKADQLKKELQPLEVKYSIKITFSLESEPLGTAGPLNLAKGLLTTENPSQLFFVFNSDIICDFPLAQLLERQNKTRGQGTIVLAKVTDPSRFGVVVTDQAQQQVLKFVQKPKEFVADTINAGIYLLHTSVIDRIPNRFCMIENQVFPQMAVEGKLFALPLANNFWFDIGKPGDYLSGQQAYLDYWKIVPDIANHTKASTTFVGSNMIDSTVSIGQYCSIGPNVIIGPNCKIGNGVRLANCTLIANNTVGDGCYINNAIVSWKTKLESWVRIEGLTVIAEQVVIKKQARLTCTMVLSNLNVTGVKEKETVM